VKLRVNKAYKASFDYVVFKKGDKVKVGREDPEDARLILVRRQGWRVVMNPRGIPQQRRHRRDDNPLCMHILTSILRSHRFVIFSSPIFSTIIHNRQKVHDQLLLYEIESETMPRDHICGALGKLVETARAEATLNDNNHR